MIATKCPCGEKIPLSNYNKDTTRYCSSRCRQKAYRDRKRRNDGLPPTPITLVRDTARVVPDIKRAQMPPWARWDKKKKIVHRLRKQCSKIRKGGMSRVHFGAARALVKAGFASPCTVCFADFDVTVARKLRMFHRGI